MHEDVKIIVRQCFVRLTVEVLKNQSWARWGAKYTETGEERAFVLVPISFKYLAFSDDADIKHSEAVRMCLMKII